MSKRDSTPLVTVVIPTRNRILYLRRLLQSIRAQCLQEFECIVIDDNSSQDTIALYDDLWSNLDSRFQIQFNSSNEGLSSARNRGVKEARGKYIAFCDDDDIWVRNDHLSEGVRLMTQHGGDLLFTSLQVSSGGEIVRSDFYEAVANTLTRHPIMGEASVFEIPRKERADILRHKALHADTIIAERELFMSCGAYWEKLRMIEDCDFGFRIFDKAKKVLYRNIATADYDTTPRPSIFRSSSAEEIALFAILSTLHAEVMIQDSRLRRAARHNRASYLAELAQSAAEAGNKEHAREFAIQSLMLCPTKSAILTMVRSTLSHIGARKAVRK